MRHYLDAADRELAGVSRTNPRVLWQIAPWIEARFRGSSAEMFERLAAQTHRRFFKTHLPVDGVPIFDEVRYLHVARDGRDAFMSWHNHHTAFSDTALASFDKVGLEDSTIGRPFPRAPTDPAEHFRRWISTSAVIGQTDGTPELSYFDLEAGYWTERRRPNFLMVHFNDLLVDLDAEMRRIAAFLEIEVNERVWHSLVRAADFKEMQARGEAIVPGANRRFGEGACVAFSTREQTGNGAAS